MTKTEQKAWDRYLRWQNYRGEVSTANKRIAKAKKLRKSELEELAHGCYLSQRTIKKRCADARSAIRKRARDVETEQRALKRRERDDYSLAAGSIRKAKKMTRAENDSLAEHNIPTELLDIWREDRKRYDYAKAPDMRAELFLEWAEKHGDEIAERQQAKLEEEWPDLAYAREFEQHQEEAVPF